MDLMFVKQSCVWESFVGFSHPLSQGYLSAAGFHSHIQGLNWTGVEGREWVCRSFGLSDISGMK